MVRVLRVLDIQAQLHFQLTFELGVQVYLGRFSGLYRTNRSSGCPCLAYLDESFILPYALLLLLLVYAGLLAPSSGEVLLCGESILTEGGLDRATGLIGVCPQFDVLWGELTGLEHLLVAGHVKGLPWAEVGDLTEPSAWCYDCGRLICFCATCAANAVGPVVILL